MENRFTVGEILKPQGVRGELKVKPFTDTADVFRRFKRVYIGGEAYRVLSARVGDGAVFLGLNGVPDRNAAELLRGKQIEVPREDMPEVEKGSYYIADLLESEVFSSDGEPLGVLTDIRQAATDIYTVTKDGKETLFPAVSGVIEEIDVQNKKIIVNIKRFQEVAVS